MNDEPNDRRIDTVSDRPSPAERQVQRTAQELIETHGCDQAAVEAAHQAQDCVNKGDQPGCQRWMQVLHTIRTWYDNRTTGMIAF
jgi:hypothetical protein